MLAGPCVFLALCLQDSGHLRVRFKKPAVLGLMHGSLLQAASLRNRRDLFLACGRPLGPLLRSANFCSGLRVAVDLQRPEHRTKQDIRQCRYAGCVVDTTGSFLPFLRILTTEGHSVMHASLHKRSVIPLFELWELPLDLRLNRPENPSWHSASGKTQDDPKSGKPGNLTSAQTTPHPWRHTSLQQASRSRRWCR